MFSILLNSSFCEIVFCEITANGKSIGEVRDFEEL